MEKTLQKHIEELLHLYDEARTTDAQERELADFFSQPHDDLPEEWEKYAALFTTFAHCDSLFSEAELEEMTAPLPHRSRRVWPWTLGVAATIALVIGFFLHQPQPTESSDYLAIAEQPIQGVEELVITTVDSALMGRIAGLDIVPNSADMGDSVKIMQLGETTITPSDTEPSSTSPSLKEVMIGSHQVAKSHELMAFNSPTLDASKVFAPAEDAMSQPAAAKEIHITGMGNTPSFEGLGHPETLCVSVNDELSFGLNDFLVTLTTDEIREYFLSQGLVFDNIDTKIVADDSYIKKKYGDKVRDKQIVMEITLTKKKHIAELDTSPASYEMIEIPGFGNTSQEGTIALGEESPDDWTIAEEPIQNMKELDITSVDSALMGIKVGLDTSPDYKEPSQKKAMKFTGAQKSQPTYYVSVDGELPPSSMNRLLTLTKNEIRKYTQSQGEEIEDFDVLITNGEKVW